MLEGVYKAVERIAQMFSHKCLKTVIQPLITASLDENMQTMDIT
jgi:hypothetical protein